MIQPEGKSSVSQALPRPSKRQMLQELYLPIKEDMFEVEAILKAELDRDVPWLNELVQHTSLAGGKRMRPALVLLSGAAVGEIFPAHHYFAAALEMIHTATLIHDDVLDKAETRRHRETINSKWDDKTSVLLGDYLFTHSFCVASRAGVVKPIADLAMASNRVCEGEMRQNAWCGNFEISEEQYIEMVSQKTAELCSFACSVGAQLSGAEESLVQQFNQFGMDIGIAFQIVDDVLDLVGKPDEVGKTLGTDLINKKPTLPVIHCLGTLEPDERSQFLAMLDSPEPVIDAIMTQLSATKSIDYARHRARSHAERAVQFASELPGSDSASVLKTMAEFILERTF